MDKKYADYWNTWKKPIRNYMIGVGVFLTAQTILLAYLVTHWG